MTPTSTYHIRTSLLILQAFSLSLTKQETTIKLEGLSTYLTFLDIEIDTITMQVRLPLKKLSTLRSAHV